MELIRREGGKVVERAEAVDKEKVREQVECLGRRWDGLLKRAEGRSVPATLFSETAFGKVQMGSF